jgi:hypothetical protein
MSSARGARRRARVTALVPRPDGLPSSRVRVAEPNTPSQRSIRRGRESELRATSTTRPRRGGSPPAEPATSSRAHDENMCRARYHPAMLSARSLLASLSGVLVTVVACSGDDGAAAGVTAEQACDSAARAICEKLQECAPAFVRFEWGDTARCSSRFKINCASAFTAAGTSATPSALSQCGAAINTATCDDVLRRKYPAPCGTEPGKLADGAPCGHDAQCVGRLCRTPEGHACGACSALGAAGASCGRDEDCDRGLACAGAKCVKYREAGESCGRNEPCAPTLACTEGKCAVALGAGARCARPIGEFENACDLAKGYYCDATGTCATIGTADAGEKCGIVDAKLVFCAAKGSCVPTTLSGTCQAPAADGATCNDFAGPKCLAPASCVNGICTITDPATCR